MTKKQMIEALAWLREVQKEFRGNTNLDTIIRTYETVIKEMEK